MVRIAFRLKLQVVSGSLTPAVPLIHLDGASPDLVLPQGFVSGRANPFRLLTGGLNPRRVPWPLNLTAGYSCLSGARRNVHEVGFCEMGCCRRSNPGTAAYGL